ncbi:hypothetical protein ACHQM5_016485 [Ranunculus cassubicifolius]
MFLVPPSLKTEDEKLQVSRKGKKGTITVRVGLEEAENKEGFQTFVIPISDLYHPLFKNLLDKGQEMYGCHSSGLLRLPCSVEEFQNLRSRVDRETSIPQFPHQSQPRLTI